MSKLYAILIALLALPAAQALEIEQKDSFEVKENFRSFNPTEKSNFQILINNKNSVQLYSKTEELHDFRKRGSFSFTSDTSIINDTHYWITGTRFPGKSIFFSKDEVEWTRRISPALDSEAISKQEKVFTTVGTGPTRIYNTDGTLNLSYSLTQGMEKYVHSDYIDSDSNLEYLITKKRGGFFSIDRDGLEWRIDRASNTDGLVVEGKLVAYWGSGVSMHHPVNGTEIWKVNDRIDSTVVFDGERIIYSSDGELVFRDKDGEVVDTVETDLSSPHVFRMPERDWIGLQEDEGIAFYSPGGEKVDSFEVEGLRKRPKIAQYDEDPVMELGVASGNEVKIFDIGKDLNTSRYGVEKTVFVGDGSQILKAVSMNASVMVGDDFQDLNESIETSKNFLGVGDVSGVRSVDDIDTVLEDEEKLYYADSREKQVYVAALASRKEDTTITFDPGKADRDFSDYSLHEIQGLFIESYEPHHLTVADLESGKGVLAAYMAAKQGSMPVDLPEQNNNGVILEDRVNSTFARIGKNRNTVFEGKYISILEGPSQTLEDPVDGRFLNDPKDGESFRTDVNYGDLDGEGLLEAGVGRYPGETEMASTVFHRSMRRKIGSEAVVASEYMDSNWPVILATGGGGLRYGSRVESVLREEGYNTTHLVEQRSEPVSFLVSLTPVELNSFLGEVEDTEEMLKKYVSDSRANMAGNAMMFIKALSYVEQIMEMYYEFRWSTYEIDIDRGMERLEELDVDLSEEEGSLQKSVMKVLYAFVWPERHPEVNRSSLGSEMKTADIVYYQGVGSSDRWVMPNNDSSTIKDHYTGENSFEPSDIPEINRSIVWDNSDLAGTRDAEMREKFFEQGASSFIGYSSVNYGSHSSISGYNFFLRWKTLGNSMKAGLNRLKMADFVYSPTLRSGINRKMTHSLRMYGNPEMPKDPIQRSNFETERSCSENICTLNISLDTPQKVEEFRGEKTLISNASSYIMEPGAPITPLYSFRQSLPDPAEVIDVEESVSSREVENLSMQSYRPLAYGSELQNTRNLSRFPGRTSNFSADGDEVRYAVAGVRKENESYQVVEKAELRIRYRSPVTLDFAASNRTLEASVSSEEDFSGELVYRTGNSTRSRDVEIGEGRNLFELENLSYGRHEVKVYILEDGIMARRVETVTARRPLEVLVFSPDIRRGSSRKATAVVSNPNRFTVNGSLELETGRGISPGMLEDRNRDVSIKGGSETRVKWRIIGTEVGNSTLTVNGSAVDLEVGSSRDSKSVIGTGRFFQELSSPTSQVKSGFEDRSYHLTWRTGYGRMEIDETAGSKSYMLSTPEFRVEKVRKPGKIVEEISNSRGSFRRIKQNGVVTTSGRLDESYLEHKLQLLENEVAKMKGFSRRS